MSIGFYFKNFAPAEELETYANLALSRVLDLAPYGAVASAVVERVSDGYRGHIEICSKWGPFFASIRGDDPKAAVDRLLEKMQEKLQTWHLRRVYKEPHAKVPILTQ